MNTNALDVFIECFSEHDGDLIYDHDCLPGRMLTDHDLFFVRDGSGEIHTHIFNADDHFIGYDDKMDVPFVEPVLQVGSVHLGLSWECERLVTANTLLHSSLDRSATLARRTLKMCEALRYTASIKCSI